MGQSFKKFLTFNLKTFITWNLFNTFYVFTLCIYAHENYDLFVESFFTVTDKLFFTFTDG